MPGMATLRIIGWNFDFIHFAKFAAIDTGKLGAALDEPLEFPELMDTDRGLNIAQIVFESMCHHVVMPVSLFAIPVPRVESGAVQREHSNNLGQALPVHCYHSTLTGCKVFRGVKA